MFGRKSDNQTTVGAATVQSPSMLDNVSSQDFPVDEKAASEVQQHVQKALAEHQMKQMAGRMSEPPTTSGPPPVSPPPASSPVAQPTPVATPPEQPMIDSADEASLPRPLTPEEDKAALEEVASAPNPSPLTAPATPASPEDHSSVVSGSALDSPSGPVSPPPHVTNPDPDAASSPDTDDSAPKEESDDAGGPNDIKPDDSPSDDSSQFVGTATDTNDKDTPKIGGMSSPVVDKISSDADTDDDKDDSSVTDDDDKAGSRDDNNSEGSSDDKPDDGLDEADAPEDEGVDQDKLAGMKQQALEHLEPLADHLDQTPEEEFKTTLMRIQANDNHALLDKALNAAKNITDDKERAQAMLDIVNEINYFSQIHSSDTDSEK